MAKPKTTPPEARIESEPASAPASADTSEAAAPAVPEAALARQIETGTPVPIDDAGVALAGGTSDKPPLGPVPQWIAVLSKAPAGFRRGGRAHQPGVTQWRLDAFTSEQIAQIEADPLFEVQFDPDLPPASS